MDSLTDRPSGTPGEVFGAFLKLGLTAFGGPIAHLGYFRDDLVLRRRWVDEAAYADLVALCQFLPGPASSQVGFSLGLLRAGPLGALAAWAAFTLPSALLLLAFAMAATALDGPLAQGVLHGLKLVAVAVVAQAVWGMARTLTPDRQRASIAVVAIAAVVLLPSAIGQVLAIGMGMAGGLLLCRQDGEQPKSPVPFPVSRRAGWIALALFALLLVGLPLLAAGVQNPGLSLFDGFYRAGALVFGGGHVVLPLLETETVARGWVSRDAFMAGYGATQAMPGPLFTFAAYLGAVAQGWGGAAIALVGVFLPGFLLLVGVLPFWNIVRAKPWAQAG
ncbi:MAG: chromate efflux transporter, partial [Alphaproteobacteria bacterium]|nr:chromate efflux transporter [Alphaproteobacteria bacterium]